MKHQETGAFLVRNNVWNIVGEKVFASKKNLIESIRSIEYNERAVFTYFWRKTHGIFDLSRMRRKVECIPEMGSDILQRRQN